MTSELSTIAVERTLEFQNQSRYGSLSSSTCERRLRAGSRWSCAGAGRRRARRTSRRWPSSRRADRRARTPASARDSHRAESGSNPGCGRLRPAPSPRTPATRCRPATSLRSPAAVCGELLLQVGVGALRACRGLTSYLRSDGYLEDVQQVGGQVRRRREAGRPASRRTRRSGTGSAPAPSASAGRPASSSTCPCPGSEKASPRSAASSSAMAREPFCSAHPYGYSTRYRAPSPRPTSAVDATSTCSPPKPGHDAGRNGQRLGRGRRRSRPLRRTPRRSRATPALRPGSTSSNESVSSPIFTVIWTRARPIAFAGACEPDLDVAARRHRHPLLGRDR